MGRGVRRTTVAAALTASAAFLAACTPAPPTPEPATTGSSGPAQSAPAPVRGADGIGDPYFPKDGNGGYDTANYALEIKYDPKGKALTGHAVITAKATESLSRFNFDLHGLDVDKVLVDGAAAKTDRVGDELQITPSAPVLDGATFTTDVTYHGAPKAYLEADVGRVGFLPGADGALAQGEPHVAASWFPVNDHPRDKATYHIAITVPNGLEAISNGVLEGKQSKDGWTTWNWSVTSPMASYLALAAIGDYRVAQSTHKGMPVVLAVDADLSKSVDKELARTPEVTDFLATKFGPYPFDSMGGLVHDNAQLPFALENQTRPAYAPGFFGGGDASWVIAHEMAHQWFGDSVSVNNWSDIWLNEGFATYAEWLWSEHEGRGTVKEQFDQAYAGASDSFWDTPPGKPGVPGLFSGAVYQRGGMTLYALRQKVGVKDFDAILKGWATEKKDGNASTDDFIAYAERISGEQLDSLFDAWLFQPKRPARP
jgi:aminopeptidase N